MSAPADRYPLLKNLHIDAHRKPLREPDIEWVAQLADGIRSGRQMKPVGVESCSDGGWHVTYGYHTFLAIRQIHGAESKGETIRATECHYNSKIDHILDQAKDNNIKPFTDDEWRGLIEALLESGMSQNQVASKIGRSKFWVQTKLDPERLGARTHVANGLNSGFPEATPHDNSTPHLDHLNHEFTSPLDPTLDPEISVEAETEAQRPASPLYPTALADSNGAMGAGQGKSRSQFGTPLATTTKHPIQPAPGPSFLSLSSLREDNAGVRKNLSRRTYLGLRPEDRAAFRSDLEALVYRALDFLASTQSGEWNGDEPVALKGKVQAMRAKVRIDGKDVVHPLVEKMASGWRVLVGDSIVFVKRQNCLVIEPVLAGKVSA